MKTDCYHNFRTCERYLRSFVIVFLLLPSAACSSGKHYPEIINDVPIPKIRRELIKRIAVKARPGMDKKYEKTWGYNFDKGKLTHGRYFATEKEYDTLGRISSFVSYSYSRTPWVKKAYHYADDQTDSPLYIDEYICLGAEKPIPDVKDAYTVTYSTAGGRKDITQVVFHFTSTVLKDSLSPAGNKITEVTGKPGSACTLFVYTENGILQRVASFMHTKPELSKEYSEGRLIDSTLYDSDGNVNYQCLCSYDARGLKVYEKEISHHTGFIKVTHFEYGGNGLLSRQYSTYGNDEMIREEVVYHRDLLGRLVNKVAIEHTRHVPSRGSCLHFEAPHYYMPVDFKYDSSGNLIEEIHYWKSDSLQKATSVKKRILYTYDGKGNPVEELHINSEGHELKRIRYDTDNRWIFMENLGRGEELKRTSLGKRQFDSLGNVVIQSYETISGSDTSRLITWYDTCMNIAKEERYRNDSLIFRKVYHYTDDNQLLRTEVDSCGPKKEVRPYMIYDDKGRLLRRMQYDSNNEIEYIFECLYDSKGEIVASISFWPKRQSGNVYMMEYEYYRD